MGNKQCPFCEIVATNSDRILFQNEDIVIFKDQSPISYIHLQCIPKVHIKNINSLTANDLSLLSEMKRCATNYIKKNFLDIEEEQIILGFHVPPFTSVNHLHMHCIAPPFKNGCLKCLKVDCIMRRANNVIKNLNSN